MSCTANTKSIDLSVSDGTLSADVNVSALGDNAIVIESDGLFATSAAMPTGGIIDWSGAVAPVGYLLCDGSVVSRSTYSKLFGVIGTTFGAGDGSTTFNLPDLLDRVTVGAMGASHTTLAQTDGVVAANRPAAGRHRHTAHFHTVTSAGVSGAAGGSGVQNGPGGVSTSSVDGGSGVATDPLDGPAFMGIAKIIKT